jgi:quinohemoprotein ethanol dehydrogenase
MWDYTAVQHMLLAELPIGGRVRRVLMQAPKNGFFYVLDRETGELLSAENYVPVTWAQGVDLATGRPIEAPDARYGADPQTIHPGPVGGHNWQPMAFHPGTGLVYIPTLEMPFTYRDDPDFSFQPERFNSGVDAHAGALSMMTGRIVAALIAWDPLRQREVWRVEHAHVSNGGALATAGNLVFQGTGRASFAAYRASDGAKLFEAPTGTGVVAPPIAYRVDGEQYVAILAGLGGGLAMASGDPPPETVASGNAGRVLAWKLGGNARLPELQRRLDPVVPIEAQLDPTRVAKGEKLYFQYCAPCHGPAAIGGGFLPDLRTSQPPVYEALGAIVLEGGRLDRGMPEFASFLSAEDVADLRQYLLDRRAALIAQQSGS